MPKVHVQDLTKRFQVTEKKASQSIVVAVDNLNFKVYDGQIFTLLGPSGCGKTTTLRCIAGLEKPDTGEIRIGRTVVFSKDINIPSENRNLGMVFQSYAIWPHMTVFDNVAYPLKVRGTDQSTIKTMVEKVLELVKLKGLMQRSATQLSGGQEQRVALARALVYKPSVLLLDEPLSNLDAKLREYMQIELKGLLRRLKITTIYVTHDQMEALMLSDMIGVMSEGKILEIGTPERIYESPENRFVAEFIGKANIIPGKALKDDAAADTNFGKISCKIPEYINDGDDVLIFIRPEKILIRRNKSPQKNNMFVAKVISLSFVGEFYDCWLSIDGQKLRARLNPIDKIEKGKKVYAVLESPICTSMISNGRSR